MCVYIRNKEYVIDIILMLMNVHTTIFAFTLFFTFVCLLTSCQGWGAASSPKASVKIESMTLKELSELNKKIATLIKNRVDGKKLTLLELNEQYEREFPNATPFVVACEKGRRKDVEFFVKNYDPEAMNGMSLEEMINYEGEDSGGYTRIGLHIAAVYEHRSIVKFLLENGANAAAVDRHGHNALHYAAYNTKSMDTIELIFEHMDSLDDINLVDKDGFTPLDMTYEWNKESPIFNDIVQLIRLHGGVANQYDHIIPVANGLHREEM